jgi:hypothetical protein
MELGADRFYSIGSGFVHGFKWMTDYICDDEATLNVVAEGFAAAVVMTECAVCLFEAPANKCGQGCGAEGKLPGLVGTDRGCMVAPLPESTGLNHGEHASGKSWSASRRCRTSSA